MKRFTFVICLYSIVFFAAYAQDVSLALTTNATVSRLIDQDFTLYEKAASTFSIPFGTSSELAGNGYVKFALSSAALTPPVTYGIEQLRYETIAKNPLDGMKSFVFDVGRFTISDPGAYILSSPADGFSFGFNYPSVQIAFRSAYTGLLFLNDSAIAMSFSDKARASAASELTGSPRFIAQADVTLPQVFGQTVKFSVLSQNDLNPEENLIAEGSTTYTASKGGRLNTQYFELESSGTVASVSYGGFFAYGSGSTLSWIADSPSTGSYQYKPISSFLIGANVSVPVTLPQPFCGSFVGGRFLFASGDKDASGPTEGNTTDVYKVFVPMNTPTLATVFSPDLSNLILGEVSFSSSLLVTKFRFDGTMKFITFFRPTTGPISEPGIDAGSTSPYLGSEVDFTVSGRIMSDFALSFIGGVFIPGNAFAASNSVVQYSAGISATISM